MPGESEERMKKQEFLDIIATDDELTTSPKANETFIHFKLDTGAQACVLPEAMILSLKEEPELVDGKWLYSEFYKSDLYQERKKTKYMCKNNLETSQYLKKKKFFLFLNDLTRRCIVERNKILRKSIGMLSRR